MVLRLVEPVEEPASCPVFSSQVLSMRACDALSDAVAAAVAFGPGGDRGALDRLLSALDTAALVAELMCERQAACEVPVREVRAA